MPDVAAAIATRPLVLDGGLGTMLEARGHDLSGVLWSAGVLIDAPGDVRDVHAAFVEAGADVVTTASYQLGYDNLAAAGRDAAEVDALLTTSVRLAREASDDRAWVAASVGPFGAVRADGSEYTGAYGLSVAELTAWHRRRLLALAEAGPDLLAVGFRRELTFWQVMEVIDKLADVLRLVHARNIWHRDIKPQNVLMDRDGEIRLIDFGIATIEREQDDATKTSEGLIMGTPAFLSPEQAALRSNAAA